MESKVCNICNECKALDEFHKDKTKKDGYRGKCKICQSSYIKKYYIDNKEEVSEKNKEWRKNNYESIIKRNRKWKVDNLEKHNEIQKKSRIKNKVKINKYKQEYFKKRKEVDPIFKLRCYLARTISDTLRERKFTKKSKTCDILGCSFEEFKLHLESKFEPWMSWDNYGNPKDGVVEPNKTWDIDHIIPSSSVITEEELLKLNHFSNLKPLCSYINRVIKRNFID
jgi:hypothetical protein